MDRLKTGELIAVARREKNLTQKELAQKLHVSDRAVSKWERGAGFPDVGLLEPLAKALDLNVLDLLRGERTEEQDVHAAVQEALTAWQAQQKKCRAGERTAKLKLVATVMTCLLMLSRCGFLKIPLRHTVLAGVYVDGVQTAVTEVEVHGGIRLDWAGFEYWGELRVPLSRISMDPERKLRYEIPIRYQYEPAHATAKSWYGNVFEADRPFIGDNFCLTLFMRDFAFDMTDGRVIATTPAMYDRYADIYSAPPMERLE